MSSSVRAVVAAHAGLAEGLVAAVDAITGRSNVLRAVSNAGLSARETREALGRALSDTGATVVFTDLPGGSCGLAARHLLRERPNLSVVTGVNLPMLLEFVMRGPEVADAVASAVARGREHIYTLAADVR